MAKQDLKSQEYRDQIFARANDQIINICFEMYGEKFYLPARVYGRHNPFPNVASLPSGAINVEVSWKLVERIAKGEVKVIEA